MSTPKNMPTNYLDLMKPEDISIAAAWLHFAGLVLPPECSQLQREEMRKAFFAGFGECFKIMNDLSERLSNEDAGRILSRIEAEWREFFLSVMAKSRH